MKKLVTFEQLLAEMKATRQDATVEASSVSLPAAWPQYGGLRLHLRSVASYQLGLSPGRERIAELLTYLYPDEQTAISEEDGTVILAVPKRHVNAWKHPSAFLQAAIFDGKPVRVISC